MQRQAGFLFNDDGPALVEVTTRESQTQPGRMKVGFVIELTDSTKLIESVSGDEHPVPVAAAGQKMLCGSEFRLEMN